MTPILATFEFNDYVALAGLLTAAGLVVSIHTSRQQAQLRRLERRLTALQQQVDALLRHAGIEPPPPPPSGLSPEVEQLAKDPRQKIAAIKLHREEHPGLGLKEAKEQIEAFYEKHG